MPKSLGDQLFDAMRRVALLALSLWLGTAKADSKDVLKGSEQCLIVITDSWSSIIGQMFIFERAGRSPWQQRGPEVSVVVGKAGLGWGRGLMAASRVGGPIKREGDNRAPAGVFGLRSVFGRGQKNPGTKMPHLSLTNNVVAVNDPGSRYYNQMVDVSRIKAPDWHSVETMILADNRYKWGVFVEHNVPAKPGAGSCIFLHVWKSSHTPTAGCTAMPEEDLVRIIHWLDPARHPLLVQMPRPIYDQLRAKWNLPQCGATL